MSGYLSEYDGDNHHGWRGLEGALNTRPAS